MVVEHFYIFDDMPLIFLIASEHAVVRKFFFIPVDHRSKISI